MATAVRTTSLRRYNSYTCLSYVEELHVHRWQNYRCDRSKLPPELAGCFVKLQLDRETVAFTDESKRRSNNVCLQFFYSIVQFILYLFVSPTTINGQV